MTVQDLELRPKRVSLSLTEGQYLALLAEAKERFPVPIAQIAYEKFYRGFCKRKGGRL